MGYQALLFCPDEKTARTVTQVLTDLEFAVAPCTEPFAAVKKLMGEHFDAVVVDCDNEQNATLLFKSARNAPNNQTSLAVAVVEGQVGVAKAFRIGANLVLTKPINVEQAKGTLRVARGLLRKGEVAKPGSAATSVAAKPGSPPPPAQKPTPAAATSWPSSPAASAATSSIPVQSSTPRPKAAAAMSSSATSDADSIEAEHAKAAPPAVAKAAAQAATPKISAAVPSVVEAESGTDKAKAYKIDKTENAAASRPEAVPPPPSAGLPTKNSGATAFGSASAPAPAREVKPSVPVEDKPPTVAAEPESKIEEVASPESSASAPTLTFGGTLGADAQPVASGDSKKTLLAVIIVLLIVAAAYVAWTQFSGKVPGLNRAAPQPATTSAIVPRPAPSAAVTTTPASAPPATSVPDSASSAPTQPVGAAENSSDTKNAATTPSTEGTGTRLAKTTGVSSDSLKPSASTVTTIKVPAAKAAAPPAINKAAAAPATTLTDAPAPSLAGISADNGGTLPNLTSGGTTPTPVLQTVNVSQGLSQGLILKKTQPTYPSIALQMRIEGPVELLATISKTGNITAVKILHGDPQLARAALEAVKQWKYKPYLLDGSPVEIQTQITVNFKLPR
jgi:TonB family protein